MLRLTAEREDWPDTMRNPARLGFGGAIGLIVGVVVFSTVPQIDLAFANLFFDHRHSAFIGQITIVETARNAFKLLYIGAFGFAAIGLANSLIGKTRFLNVSALRWLFLCICFAAGPGLVSNVMLKDQWGRARPSQITEFGGNKSFSAAPTPARQCERNCSFVSGEASSIYMVFFAAGLAFRRRCRQLIVSGLIAGSLAGLIRMAQGGHFLSDVYFACIAMAITASLLHILISLLTRDVRAHAPVLELPA